MLNELTTLYTRFQQIKDPTKKEEAFEKFYLRMFELVSLGRIPATNMVRMMNNLEEASESSDPAETILRLLNYSEYVIKRGEKKNDHIER